MVLPDHYRATRTEVEQYFGNPTRRKLEILAHQGSGPTYEKIGRRCYYRIGDVEKWLRDQAVQNTAEYRTAEPESPAVTSAKDLISVKEACDRSDEKPATILSWCVRHKIGRHVKTDSGSAWRVDPDRLERLLAEREVAA